MRFFQKFYDDGNEGGGGGPQVEVLTPELKTELEELRTYKQSILNKEPEKTPEQLRKEEEMEKVNFRQYSVANDLMNDNEITQFESIRAKEDAALVYEDFSAEWDKDNPDADPETRELQKKTAFEEQYHLKSENKTLKTRGENLLKKEASLLRSPLESKYQSAKSGYDQHRMVEKEYPGFNSFIDDIVKENTPEKFVALKTKEGEQELTIDVDLTEDQRTEIAKIFKNPKTFHAYLNNKEKRDEVKAKIAAKIQGFIKINNFDKAIARGLEIGRGIGVAAGSDIGATQPFSVIKGGGNEGVDIQDAMQQIRESHAKVREKHGK